MTAGQARPADLHPAHPALLPPASAADGAEQPGRVELGRWAGRRWRGRRAAGWRVWRAEDSVLPGWRSDDQGADKAGEAAEMSGGGIVCEVRGEGTQRRAEGSCVSAGKGRKAPCGRIAGSREPPGPYSRLPRRAVERSRRTAGSPRGHAGH